MFFLFQVRVKILEARQLQGDNIQPCAKVTVYNQTKTTRVKKSTNSPYWNESFFFNFHVAPSELMDEYVEFKVRIFFIKCDRWNSESVFDLIFFRLLAQKPTLERFSKQILSSFSLVRIQFYLSWASGKWVSVKSAEWQSAYVEHGKKCNDSLPM